MCRQYAPQPRFASSFRPLRWVRGQRLARGVLPPKQQGEQYSHRPAGLRYTRGVGTSLERAQVRLYRVEAFASLDLPAAFRPRRSLGLGGPCKPLSRRGPVDPSPWCRGRPPRPLLSSVRWAWSRWDRRRTVAHGAAGSGSGSPQRPADLLARPAAAAVHLDARASAVDVALDHALAAAV